MTPYQRLVLVNQYKILARLGGEEVEFYADAAQALENGYESYFKGYLFDSVESVINPNVAKETFQMVAMFDDFAYEMTRHLDLTDDEKGMLTYCGFDGNANDGRYSFAMWLIGQENNFDRLKGIDPNSHMPTVDFYRRLLTEFTGRRKPGQFLTERTQFSTDDLKAIAYAGVYPENR